LSATQLLDPETPAVTGVKFDASIIIVSFNTRDVLRQCLQSVVDNAHGIEAEIIVVDNASSDGSAEMVEEEFPQVRLIRSNVNLGFASGNNRALAEARGRYFVLLNSDALFASGALALAISHMDDMPGCGLGGCRLVGRDGSSQPSSRCFHTVLGDAIVLSGLAARFPKSRVFGRFDRTWTDQTLPAKVDWVPGAFTILRPSSLKRVGLFDPAFFLYYEEVDLCRRFKAAGIPVWFWPDIEVVHIGGESSRQLTALDFSPRSAQVVLWRMRSTLLYYRKHHGWRVYLAKWMEQALYLGIIVRNSWSGRLGRRERVRHHRTMVRLMNQAWRDTRGGRISPPQPW
jgi:GT2 family glycosyltransferase